MNPSVIFQIQVHVAKRRTRRYGRTDIVRVVRAYAEGSRLPLPNSVGAREGQGHTVRNEEVSLAQDERARMQVNLEFIDC